MFSFIHIEKLHLKPLCMAATLLIVGAFTPAAPLWSAQDADSESTDDVDEALQAIQRVKGESKGRNESSEADNRAGADDGLSETHRTKSVQLAEELQQSLHRQLLEFGGDDAARVGAQKRNMRALIESIKEWEKNVAPNVDTVDNSVQKLISQARAYGKGREYTRKLIDQIHTLLERLRLRDSLYRFVLRKN
ncbi:MAG: hypothetical protein R6V06_07165, partial [Kiritimatiellia bacterium]